MRLVLFSILLLSGSAAAANLDADSLRREVASLSAEGKLEAALALVQSASLPASSSSLLQGKLELRGETARKKFESLLNDPDAAPATRGEALFRLGQLHYAAGRYRFAIPQFREYLIGYSKGPWADPAAYWMAYSCLQFARASHQKDYLDTGLRYLDRFKSKKTSAQYYRPLALTAKARTLLTRGKQGDTNSALTVLAEAERRAPPEEIPGVLLLSSQALQRTHSEDGKSLEDSLIWNYPFSPEASLLTPSGRVKGASPVQPEPVAQKSVAKVSSLSAKPAKAVEATELLRYTLQLGNFSVARNAEEMRKRLAGKRIRVRVEEIAAGKNRMYRVFYGTFPDVASARKDGTRLFKPLAYAFQVTVVRP